MLRQNRTASPRTRSSRAAGRRVSALAVLLVMLFSLLANAAPLLDLAAMPVPRAEAAEPLALAGPVAGSFVMNPRPSYLLQVPAEMPLQAASPTGEGWGIDAVGDPPAQIYYVTLPEDNALTALSTINSDAVSPMYTYFSIAIGVDGSYIYYDQWEDGSYDADIANPGGNVYNASTNPDGTQIWGDGVAANGCAPNIEGVPFTCTDANDLLDAGDVVIPYNSFAVPRVATPQTFVLDQFTTVAYNNNNGNVNWNGDWVDQDTVVANYRDEFASQAYNLSVGSINWASSPWTEEDDDNSASSGTIYVNTTEDELRFRENSAANDAIRRTADLSGRTHATLSFTLDGNNIDPSPDDDIRVQISSDGGSTWDNLGTYSSANDPNGVTVAFDISGYIAANTTVRFIMVGSLETGSGDGERWDIDNVDISTQSSSSSGPAAGTVLVTGSALRFAAAAAGDRIDRGADLSAADDCAALSFTLGQNGIDATGDNFAVEISGDGGTNYTVLETFDAAGDAGAKSYPIPAAYRTANFRLRFLSLDALESGEYWTVDNAQVGWNCAYPILFDARDKVGASRPIAMSRAVWATGSGTLNAFAHEMYPTNEWGTAYESPVGTNTTAGTASPYQFEYSALSIMATYDYTPVQIDANADGTYETSVTLHEGDTYLVSGISQGARVQSTVSYKPIQVVLLTGDINDSYESRDMGLLPVSIWGSSYWSPVGVLWNANPTRLYLYSLSTNGSIYITCERYGAANVTLGPVAARGVVTVDLGANQGARCYASDSTGNPTTDLIFGIGTVDTAPGDSGGDDGSRSDWSLTLYPDEFLTTEALVGLGLGKDPTDTSSTENGSPLWVTAACDSGSTYVYVDWNNDGTADGVDTNGDGTAEAGTANGILVNRLQSVRLFEPPLDEEEYDQSGARVWSRTTSGVGYGGTEGCPLALAWGQDPNNATAGAPGLDVGTSVPPLRLLEGTKVYGYTDTNGDGMLSPGDTVTWDIMLRNARAATVYNVHVYDTIPPNTTYVAGTTEWSRNQVNWTTLPDDGAGDGFPLDDTTAPLPNGALIDNGQLDQNEAFYIRFDVTLDDGEYDEIFNCDLTYTDAGEVARCAVGAVAARDWGDLPDTYGTTRLANGPNHSRSALRLGSWFDIEMDGQPVASAAGDDNIETTLPHANDEDGVTNAATGGQWFDGSGAFSVQVTGGPGCLNAWMDFTDDTGSYEPDSPYTSYADGNFARAGGYDSVTYESTTYSEHVVQNVLLNTGTTNVPVSVPPHLNGGATTQFYFRFRLSPPDINGQCTAAIAPTGFVSGGEVEDHLFDLPTPTAVKLLSFTAAARANRIAVAWETASEDDNAGFNLYRRELGTDAYTQLNGALIPSKAPGQGQGASYSWVDGSVTPGVTYEYLLEDVDMGGARTQHGPAAATARFAAFYPLIVK